MTDKWSDIPKAESELAFMLDKFMCLQIQRQQWNDALGTNQEWRITDEGVRLFAKMGVDVIKRISAEEWIRDVAQSPTIQQIAMRTI